MLKSLFNGTLLAFVLGLFENYRRLSVQLVRIEVAKACLHAVRVARLSALGLMGLGLVIALIGLGALLVHVGVFILLPCSLTAKAVLGIVLGLIYMILGGLALRVAMDEKTWMVKSGAAGLVEDALGQPPSDP